MTLPTQPVPEPIAAPTLPPDIAAAGPSLLPVARISTWSAAEWERFIEEYACALKQNYVHVHRCGGAGDKGRDIIGFLTDDLEGPWDNYQCKHYDHAIAPSDIWIELGKLCYYTLIGEYSVPRMYYIVAPKGVGPLLSQLLQKPDVLRLKLLANWMPHVATNISTEFGVPLGDAIKAHITRFDFSIVRSLSPLKIIETHATTRWHVARFGGGLPPRPAIPAAPPVPRAHERVYVRALLDAYADYLGIAIADHTALSEALLVRHLSRSRSEFYCAEALKTFSRDTVPEGTFEHLLDELYFGILDVLESPFPHGFDRVKSVVQTARALQITGNALVPRMDNRDRGGMCHQLANEGRLRWVGDL